MPNTIERAIELKQQLVDFIYDAEGEVAIALETYAAEKSKKTDFKRLCDLVAKSNIKTRSGNLSVTISIGVTQSDGSKTVDEILAEADDALYKAKDKGRNCVCYSD